MTEESPLVNPGGLVRRRVDVIAPSEVVHPMYQSKHFELRFDETTRIGHVLVNGLVADMVDGYLDPSSFRLVNWLGEHR